MHHGQSLLRDGGLLRQITDVVNLIDVSVGQGFSADHRFFGKVDHVEHVDVIAQSILVTVHLETITHIGGMAQLEL